MINNHELVIASNAIGIKVAAYIKDVTNNQILRSEVADRTTKITNYLEVGTSGGVYGANFKN